MSITEAIATLDVKSDSESSIFVIIGNHHLICAHEFHIMETRCIQNGFFN
jgi:hypothetical protein